MRSTRIVRRLALLIGATLSSSANARAQASSPPADSLYVAVDRWIEAGMDRYGVAGVALAIVREGRIVHRRGFGFADISRGYRVDPDTTVFHVASVTKLLTAIAVLQQVDAGTLDLTRDIRPSLGEVHAAGWDGDAVSLGALLSHSAGIATEWIGIATTDPSAVLSLAEYLPRGLPPIIDRPGTVIRYSNDGYAAAGRALEVATGVPWAEYVEGRILGPAGMPRSFAAPRAPASSDAIPYRYRVDTLPEPHLHEHVAPAGAVRSTATDLARLMTILLDTTSAKLLSPASKRRLFAPQHNVGDVRGFGLGSFPYPNPHIAATTVAGEVPGFSTRILLVPELGMAAVVIVNRKDPLLALGVFDSILARVGGPGSAPAPCAAMSAGAVARSGADVAGKYRSNVYDRGTFLRIAALMGPMLSIEPMAENGLMVLNPATDAYERWSSVGPATWVEPSGGCMSTVTVDGKEMLALSTRIAGPMMLERVGPTSRPEFVLLVVAVAVMILLAAFVAGVVAFARKGARAGAASSPVAGVLSQSIPALHVVFLCAYVTGLYQLAIGYDDRFAFGLPVWFSLALLIPYVALVATGILAFVLWRGRRMAAAGRVRGWLVVVASSVLLVELLAWRALLVP